MHATTHEAIVEWNRPRQAPVHTLPPQEEDPWMQRDDVASAWVVSGLVLTAVGLLGVLALLG